MNNNKNLYEIDMNSLVLWEEINGKEYSPKEKLLLFINGNNYKNCNDENNFDTIDEFFNAFLKNNPKNKEYYDSHRTNDYYEDLWNSIGNPYIIPLANAIKNTFSNISIPNMDGLNKFIIELSDYLMSYKDIFKEIQDKLFRNTFRIKNIEIFERSIEHLSKYGWSLGPYVMVDEVCEDNMNIDQINNIFLEYYSDDILRSIFDELFETIDLKDDFDEAIKCYDLGYYKACISLLFSIISSYLYKSLEILVDDKTDEGKRKSEKNAIGFALKKTVQIGEMKSFYRYHLLFSTLNEYYSYGKDFKIQPIIPNRNFILHGMYKKSVNKTDCLKVFLCLHDLLSYINLSNRKD